MRNKIPGMQYAISLFDTFRRYIFTKLRIKNNWKIVVYERNPFEHLFGLIKIKWNIILSNS